MTTDDVDTIYYRPLRNCTLHNPSEPGKNRSQSTVWNMDYSITGRSTSSNPSSSDSSTSNPCDVCSRIFKTCDGLLQHKKAKHSPNRCDACCKKFKSMRGLLQHNKVKHSGNPTSNTSHSCDICVKTFETNIGLLQHEVTKHNDNPSFSAHSKRFPCDMCFKKLNTHIAFLQHNEAKHHGYATPSGPTIFYRCCTCSKIFKTELELLQHIDNKNTDLTWPARPAEWMTISVFRTFAEAMLSASGETRSATESLNEQASSFNYRFAWPPRHPVDKKLFCRLSSDILEALKAENLATERINVGSAAETSVPEFTDYDEHFVLKDPEVTANPNEKGYATLTKNGILKRPMEFMDKCKGKVKNFIDSPAWKSSNIKLRDHRTAIVLEVPVPGGETLSIDVVIAIQASDGKTYVAKPDPSKPRDEQILWRESHSYDARKKMETLDSGYKCGRQIYRTCKVIFHREPNLHPITSYIIKSALFSITDQRSWPPEQLGEGVRFVIEHIKNALENPIGALPDYFDPSINLLKNIDRVTRNDIANRLDRFLRNPSIMFQQ